jgi:hypothetical protein
MFGQALTASSVKKSQSHDMTCSLNTGHVISRLASHESTSSLQKEILLQQAMAR